MIVVQNSFNQPQKSSAEITEGASNKMGLHTGPASFPRGGERPASPSCSAAPQAGQPAGGVQSSGFKVQGSGFRVQGSGFRVQGSGFRVQGSGFRVQGSGVTMRTASSRGVDAPATFSAETETVSTDPATAGSEAEQRPPGPVQCKAFSVKHSL